MRYAEWPSDFVTNNVYTQEYINLSNVNSFKEQNHGYSFEVIN